MLYDSITVPKHFSNSFLLLVTAAVPYYTPLLKPFCMFCVCSLSGRGKRSRMAEGGGVGERAGEGKLKAVVGRAKG